MDISHRNDEELVEGVKNGSMECFKEIYHRYRSGIYNYLYHLLGSREGAEDAAHDVFIRLYKKADVYRPEAKFSSWLYRMAKNAGLDAMRKLKTRRASSLEAPAGAFENAPALSEFLADPGPDPEKTVERDEIIRRVREGLLKLREKDRELVVLCDIQGLPHKEVADILGHSVNTVAVMLYRARHKLAGILKIREPV